MKKIENQILNSKVKIVNYLWMEVSSELDFSQLPVRGAGTIVRHMRRLLVASHDRRRLSDTPTSVGVFLNMQGQPGRTDRTCVKRNWSRPAADRVDRVIEHAYYGSTSAQATR